MTEPTSTQVPPQEDRHGLTSEEAEARRLRGESNRTPDASGRGYGRILRTNVFNLYNTILFGIGGALLALGRYSDAVISAGIGVLNALISASQEMRAKRQLDRLQLLERRPVVVVRSGRDVEVRPDDVVRGDLVRVRPGDQVVVDGPVLEGVVEVTESLLTGEAHAQLRSPGQELLSGSRCVGGGGLQRARGVGAASYASRVTAEARRPSSASTPLQRQLGFCVRLVMVLTALMAGAILLQAALTGLSLERVVQITAVLVGLVPYGLFLLVVVAYTAGAVTSSRRGALVQRVSAIESLSRVDVVCTDKTGTLTTGRLSVAEVLPLGDHDALAARTALGTFVRSTGADDPTSTALAASLPGVAVPLLQAVPFEASRRWSGAQTADATWVLGAAKALRGAVTGTDLRAEVEHHAARALRVLVLAKALDPAAPLRTPDGNPVLPALEPVALVTLTEELRPRVAETLTGLAAEGVQVLVLSGDDPATVGALATRAGLAHDGPVDGAGLADLSDAELDAVVAEGLVFGRVAPKDKERVVISLRRQGRYVAMVGDGVNDVPAIKAAQVGVAMRSGSAVTRDVADLVLTDDSLEALLPTRTDGRRIISGITVSTQLFLTRVATQALIIVAVTILGLGFPYSPAQTGLTLFTVGLPSLFLTAWARPRDPDPHLLLTLARFVLPAAVLTAAAAVVVYTFLFTSITAGFDDPDLRPRLVEEFEAYTGLAYGQDADFVAASATLGAQTGLSTFVSLASVLLILFLEPPAPFLAVWRPPSKDRRPLVLVLVLLAGLVTALVVPTLRDYFGLTRPVEVIYATVLPLLVLWFAALAASYRFRVLDRVLGLGDLVTEPGDRGPRT